MLGVHNTSLSGTVFDSLILIPNHFTISIVTYSNSYLTRLCGKENSYKQRRKFHNPVKLRTANTKYIHISTSLKSKKCPRHVGVCSATKEEK